MLSESRRFRWEIWAVVFFALAVSVPGWYIQMRLIEKLGRLEKRVTELQSRVEEDAKRAIPTAQERRATED